MDERIYVGQTAQIKTRMENDNIIFDFCGFDSLPGDTSKNKLLFLQVIDCTCDEEDDLFDFIDKTSSIKYINPKVYNLETALTSYVIIKLASYKENVFLHNCHRYNEVDKIADLMFANRDFTENDAKEYFDCDLSELNGYTIDASITEELLEKIYKINVVQEKFDSITTNINERISPEVFHENIEPQVIKLFDEAFPIAMRANFEAFVQNSDKQ